MEKETGAFDVELREQLVSIFKRYDGIGLTEAVYTTLRDAIGAEMLPCGTKLNEVELAEWFQVSRTPVQKALIRLECEELITYEHKRGYTIQQLDFKQSRDVNELYLGLYTISTILAVNQRLDHYYSQLLRTRLKLMEQEKEILPFLRLDFDFHAQIAYSTGNIELINALRRTNARSILMFIGSKPCPVNQEQFITEHLELSYRMFDLLKNADAMTAAAFMENEHNPHMSELIGAWNHPSFDLSFP